MGIGCIGTAFHFFKAAVQFRITVGDAAFVSPISVPIRKSLTVGRNVVFVKVGDPRQHPRFENIRHQRPTIEGEKLKRQMILCLMILLLCAMSSVAHERHHRDGLNARVALS